MFKKPAPTPEPKTNVKVYIRSRPLNASEKERGATNTIKCDGKKTVLCKNKPYGHFDEVFGPAATQKELFEKVVQPQVERVLAGFNCTVFAYGQTGTGKTFTMEGGRSDAASSDCDPSTGMTPRAVETIFHRLEEAGIEEFTVRVSYVELYNEELFDLLAAQTDDRERLRLFDDPAKKGAVVISGVEEIPVRTRQEVYDLLRRGGERRVTAATLMNRNSSRSHSIFTVTVVVRENTPSGEELVKTGKLNLVDLAGSEHIGRSGAEGKRAKEAGNINQSLLTLGRVITSLTSSAPHVPYRESKLTRMLQDSLGGSTITSIVATISPSSCSYEETISTLEYAMRAKNIKNHPECNLSVSRKALLKEYNTEIEKLRRDLRVAREKAGGVYISTESYEGMEREKQQLMTAIEELEGQIEAKMAQLQKFIEDMSFMDEQYENVYHLNVRYRTKLEARILELDQTKEKLADTERKLAAYTGAFNEMHKTAMSTFVELSTTRDVVHQQRGQAEKWWAVEDDLVTVNGDNETVTMNTIVEINKLLEPCLTKLDELLTDARSNTDKLDSTMEAASVSSREDIQVVRGQLQSIRHLMEGLQQNCGILVKEAFDKVTKSVAEAETRVVTQMKELSSAADSVTDSLQQLAQSINSARVAIADGNETLQGDVKQLLELERAKLDEEKKSREGLRNEISGKNTAFQAKIADILSQLTAVAAEKQKSDEELLKRHETIDMAAFDFRCQQQESLSATVQAFDDLAGEQLEMISTNKEELEARVASHRDNTNVVVTDVLATSSSLSQSQKEHATASIDAVNTAFATSSESIVTSATLGSDACDRVDLTIDDTVQDVRAILNDQFTKTETAKDIVYTNVDNGTAHLRALKKAWRKRTAEVEIPAREHAEIDEETIAMPPSKKDRILKRNGLSEDALPALRTRESLLDIGNVPLSPASLAKKKRTTQLEDINEEVSAAPSSLNSTATSGV